MTKRKHVTEIRATCKVLIEQIQKLKKTELDNVEYGLLNWMEVTILTSFLEALEQIEETK